MVAFATRSQQARSGADQLSQSHRYACRPPRVLPSLNELSARGRHSLLEPHQSSASGGQYFQVLTINLGGVICCLIVLRPKLFQIASQGCLTVSVERGERSLRGTVVGAEMFDDFSRGKGKIEPAHASRQFQF